MLNVSFIEKKSIEGVYSEYSEFNYNEFWTCPISTVGV